MTEWRIYGSFENVQNKYMRNEERPKKDFGTFAIKGLSGSPWGSERGDVYKRQVDTLVKQLRKKMTDKYPYITSVYGVGYRFEVK